ncbi:hypothetical protein VE03_10735 [Pseudogymnoascus sp. 23342-1-I1]|nr:hypothetical protein VE03_10735 [Pseudogymnoascus sp. 23342-1-I1]
MGCGFSKPQGDAQGSIENIRNGGNQNVEQPAQQMVAKLGKKGDQKCVRDDFTDVVNTVPVEDDIEFSLEELPPYSEKVKPPTPNDEKVNNSKEIILKTVLKAHKMQEYGSNGAFSVLGERLD